MNAVKQLLDIKFPSKITLTSTEYHNSNAVGSSSLKHMLKSPAHYHYNLRHPKEPTPAMKLGTAIHEAILEPHLFMESIVMPKFEGTGMKARKEAWVLENHGKRIISGDDQETIAGIMASLQENTLAKKLLSTGAAEESYFWQCPSTGIVCKCRPDFLRTVEGIGEVIIDVKSTVDASPDGFPKQIANFNYHMQAAHYLNGVSAVLGRTVSEFIIIAIEKEAPHGISIHRLDAGTLDAGRFLARKALAALKECKASAQYPGYPEKILTSSLPNWAYPVEDINA